MESIALEIQYCSY